MDGITRLTPSEPSSATNSPDAVSRSSSSTLRSNQKQPKLKLCDRSKVETMWYDQNGNDATQPESKWSDTTEVDGTLNNRIRVNEERPKSNQRYATEFKTIRYDRSENRQKRQKSINVTYTEERENDLRRKRKM